MSISDYAILPGYLSLPSSVMVERIGKINESTTKKDIEP